MRKVNDNMWRDTWYCMCNDSEHDVAVEYDAEDDTAWLSVRRRYKPFRERLLTALRYLFRRQSEKHDVVYVGVAAEQLATTARAIQRIKKREKTIVQPFCSATFPSDVELCEK